MAVSAIVLRKRSPDRFRVKDATRLEDSFFLSPSFDVRRAIRVRSNLISTSWRVVKSMLVF